MDIPADADPSGEYGHPFCHFLPDGSPLLQKDLAAGRMPEEIKVAEGEPLIHIDGKRNFLYIGIIIIGVVANGFLPEYVPFFKDGAGVAVFDDIVFPYATIVEIALILLASFLSLHTTPYRIHKANAFPWRR